MKAECYQQKKDYFIYEMFYIILMATIKQKSRAEAQNIKWGRLSKSPWKTTNLQRQAEKEKETMGKQNNQKAKDKMAAVNTSISISP